MPGTLDWDLWLGGASMRAFSPYYTPYNWRGFLDFGTGQIGNWATHTAGPVQTALQLGAPTSWSAISVIGQEQHHLSRTAAMVRMEFPARGGMPPVKVFYHDATACHRSGGLYHVPGMENETILPPANNLADKGRPMGGRGGAGGGRGGCRRPRRRRGADGRGRVRAVRACRCSANRWVRRSPAF